MSLDWSCDFTHASSHNQSFQWCHMSSSSSKQVTTICKNVDSSKLFKFCEKKGRSRKMKCFKQLQRRRKGRVSKSKLAFGNDAEVATVVIIKDSRGMKWTWYISVPISWQIYNELGILERIMSILFENGLLPPHYSKSQIFVQKFNFDKTFSRVFHPIFFDNFSREIKVVNS